jgi:hypothetical protein
VTYEIVTPESAEGGEVAEGETLRDAISDLYDCRTSRADSGQGIEDSGRWFTYYHGQEYETGAYESRSLHVPGSITPSSYRRIAKLLGVKKWKWQP